MVRPVANSYALTALAAHETPSDIVGGSLVCIQDNSTTQSNCPSVAFIYRYTSTRLEVRDYFDADSIYATLLSTTLPSEQELKLSIEYALHGTFAGTVYIIIIARNTDNMQYQFFLFDPWNQSCNLINTTCCIKIRITAAHISKAIDRKSTKVPDDPTEGHYLLVLGTEIGSVTILSIIPEDIFALRSPHVIVKQSRSQSVASIEVCVPPMSTNIQAYIFVGGFNGEIEALIYGTTHNEYGVIDSKIVTTLWKNMPVVKMSVFSLASSHEELLISAGQAERSSSAPDDAGSTSRTPSITILKVRTPSLKSMEVSKKELTSKATDAALVLPPNSTSIKSLNIYISGSDDVLYLSSIWAYQPPNRLGRLMYACWKVSNTMDKLDFLQQHVVKTTSRLLDACMSGTFGTVAILCCSGLDVAHTSNFQCIKRDRSKYLYDYDATAKTIKVYENEAKDQEYDEKRSLLGMPLIIDKLLVADGYGDHYPPSQQTLECFASSVQSQFKLSGRGISDALLYTVLDTMGETEFGKLSEDNHLSQDTRERIQEYWSVDNLQIQSTQAVHRLNHAATYSNNYVWSVKQQFGVSAAVGFMKTHHIPVDGISDWEVTSAFLELSPSFDAALCLSQPSFKSLNHSNLPEFLPGLVSRWFKEIESNKDLAAKLLGVVFDNKLETEVLKYCSITNPTPTNLSFLFSYYLNRYRYAEAMMIHEKLSQYEDQSNVAMQQRKVIMDSTSKLVPSIQLKLALVDADNLTDTQYHPLSTSLFVYNSSKHIDFDALLQRLIHQTRALNPNTPKSNPFSRPPNMATA